jgi:hypothetical protein
MQERNPKSLPPQHQDHQPGDESEMIPRPDFMPRQAGSGRLKGKTALITGGDSGIGRAVSVLFAREGAQIAIVYLEEDDDAKKTEALVRQEGTDCLLIKGDIGSSKFCADAVKRTLKQFNRLDVLINNAAEQHEQEDVEDISEEQLVKTFRTNLFGYMFMTQAALPHLKEGSAIVNTASVTAYRGHETWSTTPRPRVRWCPLPGRCPPSSPRKGSGSMPWPRDRSGRRSSLQVSGRTRWRNSVRIRLWVVPVSPTRSRHPTSSSLARIPPT